MATGFLPAVVLFNLPAGVRSLDSGVRYSTQPTEIPTNALVWENGKIYEYVRLSGTATVGDMLYATGVDADLVEKSMTGVKPYGVSLVAPTASGDFTFILKRGIHTGIQITNTFGGLGTAPALFGGFGSAAANMSNYMTHLVDAQTDPIAHSVTLFYIGFAMSAATGSTVRGFIDLF